MDCGKLEEWAICSRQSYQAHRDKSNALACFALFKMVSQANFNTLAIGSLVGLSSAML